jgi:hypothetical protein
LLQTSINFLYRLPKSKIKKYKRFGGYYNYQKIVNGNKQMAKAVHKLPPSPSYPDALPLYFLTGKNYIHQTIFCIRSLSKVSTEKFHFILVDDGTFTLEINNLITKKLPGATVVSKEQIKANLAKYLPTDKFPVIHNKRKVYPHIKKLTDVHTINLGSWKMVLDSDMFFWKEPTEIINWLKQPVEPIHMVDCEESYGYSRSLMSELSQADIPKLLNVGIIGLNSNDLNWDTIEYWIKSLEERESTSYYLEQGLTAMIVSQNKSIFLNKDDYKVNPTLSDLEKTANILHHYVDLSKEVYLKKAWQLVI